MKVVLYSIWSQRSRDRTKYEYYFERYNAWDDIPSEMSSRPKLENLWDGDYWVRFLRSEIHEWLISYNLSYFLSIKILDENTINECMEWIIDIPDDNKAMLFKLTWC